MAGRLLPPDLLESQLPDTERILGTLARLYPTVQLDAPATIADTEFITEYKVTKESTSSSPSGRHVGHYKAILDDPTLVNLHSIMMSIPFQVGFAPARWSRVMDIMLEKEAGNARCHRLCILALFESDFNQSKRILIDRCLTHHLEYHQIISDIQFGSRPGKQCQSAVLK